MLSKFIAEPDYAVTRHLGLVELRHYQPFVVAEIFVAGPPAKAMDQAFPILSAYIFGQNKGARTAPAPAGLKLEMSAPVTQFAAAGGQLVQFMLPRGMPLDAAPEPLDPRVRLRAVGAHPLAVIHFSGFWSEANCDEHLRALKSALNAAGLGWTGEPIYARYNAPFTPWFMRHTEIWLRLAPAP
jgi:hypothetical protein